MQPQPQQPTVSNQELIVKIQCVSVVLCDVNTVTALTERLALARTMPSPYLRVVFIKLSHLLMPCYYLNLKALFHVVRSFKCMLYQRQRESKCLEN